VKPGGRMKHEILAAIGEGGLSQPYLVNAALAANDRIKYEFALLQMAAAHARAPDQAFSSLKRERIACGIDDPALDEVVASARRVGDAYQVRGAASIFARIAADLRLMATPVIQSGGTEFAARQDALLAALPNATNDTFSAVTLDIMTHAGTKNADSLHQLVMDLHKALNGMQAALAEEHIDGAAVYGVSNEDRTAVATFMAGLNRTARLKFDHPGLATTAARHAGELVIQNDIGTTDAHVLVIHVTGLQVTVTYADVHTKRLAFFQDMLSRYNPAWETSPARRLGEGDQFDLTVGTWTASDTPQCLEYLAFLGSRLVFLIDWNRARKQLRGFLPSPARLRVLREAARLDVGHRAFLELGGARLVNQAIEAIGDSAVHFGDRLSDVLGVAETETFLIFALRAAAEGMLAHQSASLIRDRVRVELSRHFSNEERRLLRLAAEHAGLIGELALLSQEAMLIVAAGEGGVSTCAARASRFEHDADGICADVRLAAKRRPGHAAFETLLRTADDAADALEEAVFLSAMFAPGKQSAETMDALLALAALLVTTAQEWVKVLAHADHAQDPGAREDIDDLLTSLDRVLALEHEVDDAQRALSIEAVRSARDFRELHLAAAVGDRLEEAADALKRTSLMLRDHVLDDVLNG
jgi:uncharacterized protein Yka (UPF0111/DUF47 family)